MSLVFNNQSPYYNQFHLLKDAYIQCSNHQRILKWDVTFRKVPLIESMHFSLPNSIHQRNEAVQKEVLDAITTLLSEHFFEIVNVQNSDPKLIEIFSEMIGKINRIKKNRFNDQGKDYIKDYTLAFNKLKNLTEFHLLTVASKL